MIIAIEDEIRRTGIHSHHHKLRQLGGSPEAPVLLPAVPLINCGNSDVEIDLFGLQFPSL